MYAVEFAIARMRGESPDIASGSFEPARQREEKRASNIVAAIAAMLFFLCAMRIARLLPSLVATVAFAFGTDMWSVGSQALWQHGSVVLVTLAMVLALLSAPPALLATRAMLCAGLAAGFLPVVRPTAALFSLAAFAFVFFYAKRGSITFVAAVVLGFLPGLLWNVLVFHSLAGGYAINESSYTFSFAQASTASYGLLLSPSRGLLIYTPFVLVSVAGLFVVMRLRTPEARLIQFGCIASLGTFANYMFFQRWEGGSTFGPRYLTDITPVAGLLVLYAFPFNVGENGFAKNALTTLGLATIVFSIAVQFVGANGEPKTNWSGVPDDASLVTARIWDWHDTQIERDAQATAFLFTANPTAPAAYATGFDGTIYTIDATNGLSGTAGGFASYRVTLRNTGSSRWFGYESGLYYGQTRVRVRFFDNAGSLAREGDIFIASMTYPNEETIAAGAVALPTAPGTYTAIFDIDVNQDARIGSRHVGARSERIEVRT